MARFVFIALVVVFGAPGTVSAQTPPASTKTTLSVRGCVAPVQRDGTLAPKAGATATPETAPMEANSTEPTGVFMLLDATAASRPDRTAYTLYGHEPELSKYNGSRVEVVGSIMPKVGSGDAGKSTAAADGVQRIRVGSVKKIAGSCSAAKK